MRSDILDSLDLVRWFVASLTATRSVARGPRQSPNTLTDVFGGSRGLLAVLRIAANKNHPPTRLGLLLLAATRRVSAEERSTTETEIDTSLGRV